MSIERKTIRDSNVPALGADHGADGSVVDTTQNLPPVRMLPSKLTKLNPGDAITIQTQAGLHAMTVPVCDIASYEAMGVHLCKPGEGYLRNEALFEVSDEGYLTRGGDVVGVITNEAYHDFLQHTVAQDDAESGLVIKSEKLTEKGKGTAK